MTVLSVTGDMTVHFSSEILSVLMRVSGNAESLELDLRKVTAIDLAGLQLICAVYRTSRQNGRKFSFHRKIPAVIESAIERAGFRFYLEDLLSGKEKGYGKGGDSER